ncbi:GNAT family N-acetyltransferase [Streptantibioticus silvisoli]|uniref:GNAT family N-acetyltransferase n=1 Tax=Streptantibioticus silvisoli TaxID=2705255 RepID=A0ABT6VY87_9ACTN|nr:GNAT family N-acetyltransferase [Streptantibioticus silvisoli]MDI5963449.1 GNAT family N-acetyltransferase [Streptantibioticus silvisoli]
MVTVADCERVQTNWFRTRAETLGGRVWRDDGLLWTDGPDGLNLMFPSKLTEAAVRRGVDHARDLGRDIIGAWLDVDVDASALARAGFTRGWSPWWMTARLADVPPPRDDRVRLEYDSLDYEQYDPCYRDQFALARAQPDRCWYAAAHTRRTGRFAGRAWSFRDEQLAGVFDMAVWPRFRRHGLGTALLTTVCTAARQRGATDAVLNATPQGKLLYSTCGFTQIGEGITWWHHMDGS